MNRLIVAVAFFIMVIVILLLATELKGTREELKYTKTTLGWYENNYLTKNGCLASSGSYYFMSFDGGKNWWDATRTDHQVIINGRADPKILDEINAWDALTDHVMKNGPIHVGNMSKEEEQMLGKTGITVERK
jgi:hypothetical protein